MDKPVNSIFELDRPNTQTIPFVFSSPHSGTNYLESFVTNSKLDPLTLRGSEDSFVDDLFAEVPNYGAPFLKALFPRAYLDPNREAYELDQQMFLERLPEFVNTNSPRVFAGLGTVPRVITNGAEIYQSKLPFEEAKHRINSCYLPYHAALKDLIKETKLKNKFSESDLRAKTASDTTEQHAFELLDHSTSDVTRRHYRRKPKVVKPFSLNNILH